MADDDISVSSDSTDIKVEDLPEDKQPQTTPQAPIQEATPHEHFALLDYFNIDRPTSDEDAKLAYIWDYLRANSKSTSKEGILMAFVKTKNQLGTPRLGESPLDKIYRYVKLKSQLQLVKEEMKRV